MSVTLESYFLVSTIFFCIGLVGLMTRRNAITLLVSVEIMLNAANLNLVAFSKFISPKSLNGQVFSMMVIGIAAAESAVALAIIMAIYKHFKTIDVEKIKTLKEKG